MQAVQSTMTSNESRAPVILREDNLAQSPACGGEATTTKASAKEQADKEELSSKPKRPLSGYNLFFRDQRELLLKAIPSRDHAGTGHGKIGFQDLAKQIGAKWKEISPQEKERYERIAAVGRKEYLRRIKEWKKIMKKNGKATSTQVQKRPKSKKPIKRIVSAEAAVSSVRESSPTISAPQDNSTFKCASAGYTNAGAHHAMPRTFEPRPPSMSFTTPSSNQWRGGVPSLMTQAVPIPFNESLPCYQEQRKMALPAYTGGGGGLMSTTSCSMPMPQQSTMPMTWGYSTTFQRPSSSMEPRRFVSAFDNFEYPLGEDIVEPLPIGPSVPGTTSQGDHTEGLGNDFADADLFWNLFD